MNFVMSQIYMELSKSIQSMKKHYFYSHQKPTKLVYEICLIPIVLWSKLKNLANFLGAHPTSCKFPRKNNNNNNNNDDDDDNNKMAHRCHKGPIFPCKLIYFWIVYIDSAAGNLDRHIQQLFRE